MKSRPNKQHRAGTITILSAVMMVVVFGMLACAVDLGYLCVAKTELKRTADATALAAAWELLEQSAAGNLTDDTTFGSGPVFDSALEICRANPVCREAPEIAIQDLTVGYIANPLDPTCPLTFENPAWFNAVRVRVHKSEAQNGAVPLFFARAIGGRPGPLIEESTAVFINSVCGVYPPKRNTNVMLLPFALDINREDVKEFLAGTRETCNLFPQDLTPGNCGTIDFGGENNSTADIARQILSGVNSADWNALKSAGKLDENDRLTIPQFFNGDTGISAGVKDELASLINNPNGKRLIPLFDHVSGPGNNSQFHVVDLRCVTIEEVKLTGAKSAKRVIIKKANKCTLGVVPSTDPPRNQGIYSPVWLAR
ncbi:MAG: hypothetical protein GXY25_06925 [Pirellulaceae bacterium]|jgi:hypothetical protein|nr:pilus assembly protein TadG-related protein [Thermoguttaceae bacterium]MDI9446148.1 pilus assembly protein TadG-related protein [Planctomycetota bacterium]NLZ00253.1 hypothetical protein [Pirellulaceae bacterium]